MNYLPVRPLNHAEASINPMLNPQNSIPNKRPKNLPLLISWILWIIGGALQSAGHKALGYGCNWAAISVFWTLAGDLVFPVIKKRRPIWCGIAVLALLTASLYEYLLSENAVPSEAHFNVVLNTADNPRINLQLTNDFLVFKRMPIPESDVRGDLIVAARSLEQLPILRLFLTNDSSTASQEMLVSIMFNDGFVFDLGAGWNIFERGDEEEHKYRSIACHVPQVLPGNGVHLPELIMRSCANVSNSQSGILTIQIEPPTRHDSFLSFWLLVPVSTNVTKPKIVFATNNVFWVPFDIPAKNITNR